MFKSKQKQTYIINGLLDSGKTEFVKFTLQQPYFKIKDKTLVIVCEEGENEYERIYLKQVNATKVVIEEEELFNLDALKEIDKEYKPARVLIEYNGMWNQKDIELPENWKLEQTITLVDTSTFDSYYTNMKSILCDNLRISDLVLLNRADEKYDLTAMKRNIKMVNPRTAIVFEGNDSEINVTLDEELPYDINSDSITITDDTYGMWFVDMLDNTDRYVGKEVELVGQVMKRESFPEGYFVPIRMVMTCCEDDIAKMGFVCEWAKADSFKNDEWVRVKAVVDKRFWPDYGGEGPILVASSVELTIPPAKKVL